MSRALKNTSRSLTGVFLFLAFAVGSSTRALCQDGTSGSTRVPEPSKAEAILLSVDALSQAAAYAPDKPIAGRLEFVGSTLMQSLATMWAEDFAKIHPEVTSKIDCQGSEESFKKFSDASATIALLSREVTPEELTQWSKDVKKNLIAIDVGYDVLSIIVHKDNPLRALAWNPKTNSPMSLSNDKTIEKWGDLGIDGPLSDKPLTHVLIVPSHGLRSVARAVFESQRSSESNHDRKRKSARYRRCCRCDTRGHRRRECKPSDGRFGACPCDRCRRSTHRLAKK